MRYEKGDKLVGSSMLVPCETLMFVTHHFARGPEFWEAIPVEAEPEECQCNNCNHNRSIEQSKPSISEHGCDTCKFEPMHGYEECKECSYNSHWQSREQNKPKYTGSESDFPKKEGTAVEQVPRCAECDELITDGMYSYMTYPAKNETLWGKKTYHQKCLDKIMGAKDKPTEPPDSFTSVTIDDYNTNQDKKKVMDQYDKVKNIAKEPPDFEVPDGMAKYALRENQHTNALFMNNAIDRTDFARYVHWHPDAGDEVSITKSRVVDWDGYSYDLGSKCSNKPCRLIALLFYKEMP